MFDWLQSELGKKKGDFVFQTGHVIEIVTKMFLVIQNATGKPPDIHVNTEWEKCAWFLSSFDLTSSINRFEANFGQQTVTMSFKGSGASDLSSQQLTRVSRKGNRMEIIIWSREWEGTIHEAEFPAITFEGS